MEVNEQQVNETFGEPQGYESTPVPQEGDPSPQGSPELYEYQAGGKTIREDLATIKKRASQGYHYAQSMQSFNQEKEQWQQQISERESSLREMESRWKQYDDYARANPDWEQHVRTSWEQRQQSSYDQGYEGQSQQGSTSLPPDIQAKLAKMDDFLERYQR